MHSVCSRSTRTSVSELDLRSTPHASGGIRRKSKRLLIHLIGKPCSVCWCSTTGYKKLFAHMFCRYIFLLQDKRILIHLNRKPRNRYSWRRRRSIGVQYFVPRSLYVHRPHLLTSHELFCAFFWILFALIRSVGYLNFGEEEGGSAKKQTW